MSLGVEKGTPIINRVVTEGTSVMPPFATTNPHKLLEIKAGLGRPEVDGIKIDVPEIRDSDPLKVAEAKARMAYEAAGNQPVIIEDTSLHIDDLAELFPATFVKSWGATRTNRGKICTFLNKRSSRTATARTIFAAFDGETVQTRSGQITGRIAKKPVGSGNFGWDDIFIPDHQDDLEGWDENPRTFAEMTQAEKMQLSMRQEALQKLKDDPFALGIMVHALGGSVDMELAAINHEYFKGPEMAQARKHAFRLRSLQGIEPNEELAINGAQLPPFHEIDLGHGIKQYVIDPNSADIGLIVTDYDRRKVMNGNQTRLVLNRDGHPTFLQHNEGSYHRALAARAYEYALHHNPEMYAKLRRMMAGEMTEERPNIPSEVLKEMLGKKPGENTMEDDDVQTFKVPGFTDLAYTRQYSEQPTSRSKAAMSHIINRNGIPTSMLAMGGMPPVTGSRDTVATAALSFTRSYIAHNSLFVPFERRVNLFNESKAYVEEMIPGDENEDIRRIAVAQIGICISGNNMETITKQSEQAMDAGCGSMRIYTTNPGPEVVETARTIGKMWQNKKTDKHTFPFHLCVGPIVDKKQSDELLKVSKEYGLALTLLSGHGGGENCTSLEGGAAANAIEIMYDLIQDPDFNRVSLGFEGGLGTWFGPWMGLIDVISKDGSAVRGCVETQGGLSVLHKSGAVVQPYSGTASPWTQMLERTLFPQLAPRTNHAGQLNNNEGKPGYMKVSHWAPSICNYLGSCPVNCINGAAF